MKIIDRTSPDVKHWKQFKLAWVGCGWSGRNRTKCAQSKGGWSSRTKHLSSEALVDESGGEEKILQISWLRRREIRQLVAFSFVSSLNQQTNQIWWIKSFSFFVASIKFLGKLLMKNVSSREKIWADSWRRKLLDNHRDMANTRTDWKTFGKPIERKKDLISGKFLLVWEKTWGNRCGFPQTSWGWNSLQASIHVTFILVFIVFNLNVRAIRRSKATLTRRLTRRF
jgi:hypothetical protein